VVVKQITNYKVKDRIINIPMGKNGMTSFDWGVTAALAALILIGKVKQLENLHSDPLHAP
jgi:hypothetical protein